ncbi:MAG: PRC-barrel domain-containing protein [Vicinamibacteraceae bacterium]
MPRGGTNRATQLLGGRVWVLGGLELGTVRDIVIDARTGRLRYAIVCLPEGDGLVPVPWRLLVPGAIPGDYLLPLSREGLRDVPIYTPEALPDFDDRRAMAEVHVFFGCPPD